MTARARSSSNGPRWGEQGEVPSSSRRQPGQHFLPHVVGGDARPGGGGQLGEGGPPSAGRHTGARHAPEGGELGHLVLGERQVGHVEPSSAALDVEAGQWHGWRPPAGQHDVTVRRQRIDDRGEQRRRIGAGRDLVHVVDDERHLLR
jgi:hypothetical protein